MKGKLFVCIYSVILIGLFGASCYLMTIVNPPALPDPETRRYHGVNDIYPSDSLLPHDNPDYGLEKIPEGVDADEFRKRLTTKVTKYDLEAEGAPYETGVRVVPPIWPSDSTERKNEKTKSREHTDKELQSSSPVKGHRRSINEGNIQDLKESPRSILLKIMNDSGHKKIEIKFVSGENMDTQKYRKNRSHNQLKPNVSNKEMPKVNDSTDHSSYDDLDNVIQIKADDVIVLNIVDNSDILLVKSVSSDANYTHDTQQTVMNTTDLNDLNKSYNNNTKLVDLEEAENKLKNGLMHTDYTFGLWFNSENRTTESKNVSTPEYNYNLLNSTAIIKTLNNTKPFNN